MYLLDTDICSYIIRERPLSVLERFRRMDATEMGISVITQAELLYGAARPHAKKGIRAVVEDFLSRLLIVDWDGEAARHYGRLRAMLEARGTVLGNMDLMIAAHALSLGAQVVTNNTKHFGNVPGLKTVNWV